MDDHLKAGLWQQFGAVIAFLEDTIAACPDDLWHAPLWPTGHKPVELSQFWYVAYHSLFWLDVYLTGTEEGFLPPAPFALIEQTEIGPIPERAYTKAEVLAYLDACRERCKATIYSLADESAQDLCSFGWGECSFFELILYNLRHVHGHASQLSMLLGQHGVETPDYVTRVDRRR